MSIDDTFHLILMPTERCNFRCVYCYEDYAIGRMKPATVAALKRLISARMPELAKLRLNWFGGEPLVAADIVVELSAFASELCRERGVAFEGAITTNGYFLDEQLLPTLVAAGVRSYHVSLDGPQETHDRSRALASGAGTFDRIWRNLTHAQSSDLDFEFLIRLHFTPATVDAVAALMDDCARQFRDDPRFSFYFKAIERLGGKNDDRLGEFDPASRLAAQRRLAAAAAGLRPYAGAQDAVCYAAMPNSLIVRADGRISKCTVALGDDWNIVGRLTEDGAAHIDRDKLFPWIKPLLSGDFETAMCPLSEVKAASLAASAV